MSGARPAGLAPRRAAARVVAAGLVLGLAAPAGAQPVTVTIGPARLEHDPAWSGEPVAEGGAPALVRRQGLAILTVTRTAAPNPAAWRPRTRDAYLAEVEAGLVAGATRLASKRRALGQAGVPTLDLTLRRRGPDGAAEVVAVRVLLFRTMTIAAAAAAPDDRAGRRLVEGAVAGLAPAR